MLGVIRRLSYPQHAYAFLWKGFALMASMFFLFGAKGTPLGRVAEEFGAALGVEMESRDSAYKGGEYYLGISKGRKVSVESNWMDEEGEMAEPEFRDYDVLVYIESLTSQEISTPSHSDAVLLRVEEL
jgi:hypothetical protein